MTKETDLVKKGMEATSLKVESSMEIPPDIKEVLDNHIRDVKPEEIGKRELLKRMSNAAVGSIETTIDRPSPPLNVESAVLNQGTSKVVIGPNGAGKSTFFDAPTEREAFFNTHNGRGAVLFGKPVHAREYLRIARLNQEELLRKVNHRTAREVLEVAAKYFKGQLSINWNDLDLYEKNLDNQAAHDRINALVDKIVSFLDMDYFLNTKVGDLSGGERTKMALFMILLSEPDVLFLDEPTNHLDLRSIAQLISLFEDYKKAGLSILSASHVDWFLRDAGQDGVLEITWDENGRRLTSSPSPYSKYIKNPSREAVPVISGDIEWLQKDYGYKKGEVLVETPPDKFSVPNSPLEHLNLPTIIAGGDLLLFLGDNGTGKTKLLETIIFNSKEGLPKKLKGVQMAYLPQFWPEDIAQGTVRDFFEWIKAQASPHSSGSSLYPNQPPQKLFTKLVNDLKFGGKSRYGEQWFNRPLNKFSGGEQRLLWFIAVSTLQSVDVLVLDEPTNHMDQFLQGKIVKTLQSFPGTILLATHDRNLISALHKEIGLKTLVLRKTRGGKKEVSTDISSMSNPMNYVDEVIREGQQKARQLKVGV